MSNLNKTDRNALMSIAVLMIVIIALVMFRETSMYQPRPIKITPISEKSIFDQRTRLSAHPVARKVAPTPSP